MAADRPLTLMAVHAHPDDEATGTGGVLARYAAEGVRTVLVTCTDGGCGDAPGGIKPGEPGHDPAAVVALRQAELEESCRVLKVGDLELLGYHDSGMMGWPQNDAPGSFWTTPVPEAAARLAELIRYYRPDVVVTYDQNGFYGHPDHIQAHRITMAAVELTGIPAKVYWTTAPYSAMERMGRVLREAGVDWDLPDPDDAAKQEGAGTGGDATSGGGREGAPVMPPIGLPDDEVTTWVDVNDYGSRKFEALAAHASQSENIFFLNLGPERFTELMGTETFVRVQDGTGAPLPEKDLFAGLR
jgi:LmbE family N-acetylglucosaminyl deacetylase